jgi:hypothetical protein
MFVAMSTNPSEPAEQGASSFDDTAAFKRFYNEETGEPRSLIYRIFVGWWRDRS